MSVPEDGDRPTAAELASRIGADDRPTRKQPERLRFQWNVPAGVKPHIPLWFSLVVLGLLGFMVLNAILNH